MASSIEPSIFIAYSIDPAATNFHPPWLRRAAVLRRAQRLGDHCGSHTHWCRLGLPQEAHEPDGGASQTLFGSIGSHILKSMVKQRPIITYYN